MLFITPSLRPALILIILENIKALLVIREAVLTSAKLLSVALSSGKKLSKVTTEFLAKNSINSPFSPVYYDYEELDRMFNAEQETSIEIIIKEGGKEGKAKIKNKPKSTR